MGLTKIWASTKVDAKRLNIAFGVAENTTAMLAYWDKNLICRFANAAYIEWFGVHPDDMIDKMHIRQLLGPLFEKNLPYISKALEGQVQVFEREIITPAGETKTTIATYCPDFDNGEVAGFYVHVADISAVKTGVTATDQPFLPNSDDTLLAVQKTLEQYLFTGFPGISLLAKKHFISESKLKRDFKAKFKVTLFSYFRFQQMELAEWYINEKKCTKKQMAAALNFSRTSNFLYCYHKHLKEKATRKRIVDLEKANDDSYRAFIAQAPFAVAMLDEKLTFLAVSQQWISDYQIHHRPVIGESVYALLPGIADKWNPLFQKCIDGFSDKGIDQYTREDGSKIWLKWDIRPWHKPDGEKGGVMICTEDITMARQHEEDNQRILEILYKSSEFARIGTWERNFIKKTGVWSKVTKEILEVPPDFDPNIESAINFYKAGPSRNLARRVLQQALKNGDSFDIRVEMVTANNRIVPVRVIGFPEFNNGVCERLYGIFQEITDAVPAQLQTVSDERKLSK